MRIATLKCFSVICEHYPEALLRSPASLSTILKVLPTMIADHSFQVSQVSVTY